MQVRCLVAVAVALLCCSCGSGGEKETANVVVKPDLVSGADPNLGNSLTSIKAEAVAEEPEPAAVSVAETSAVRSAKQYLSMTGFSKEGLIQQLSSDAGDGYSVSEATAAVDSLSVDWNENAAKSAKQYLSMSGFSCKGMIEQLSSDAGDKYTVQQATYGARQAGAC